MEAQHAMSKIKVEKPLVILHGDEMAQIAFERILEQFVTPRLDIDLIEVNLSAQQRFTSNGRVVREAIDALKTHGVGVKNAGMTVNRAQLDELLANYPEIKEAELDKLATKSPNGAIRKGIGGNITREDIEFRNLRGVRPDWIKRDIEVDTMDSGGLDFSYSELSNASGVAKVMFVGRSGDPVELHRRFLKKGDPWMLATNCLEAVRAWARRFFQRALDERRDIYLGLKDTVVPGYDGVMRAAIEAIYTEHYQERITAAGLSYHYELIDAQAARIIANPPQRALWGVPDNVSGMKLYKLVQQLKHYGLPERKAHVSISRMSAGGGDQYGSYNAPAPEDGIVKVIVDGDEKHARHVKAQDPMLFMSNDREAIKDWVKQVFRDASVNKKEVYFGLKREFVNYDEVYSSIILEVRQELAALDTPPPSFMIMRPAQQDDQRSAALGPVPGAEPGRRHFLGHFSGSGRQPGDRQFGDYEHRRRHALRSAPRHGARSVSSLPGNRGPGSPLQFIRADFRRSERARRTGRAGRQRSARGLCAATEGGAYRNGRPGHHHRRPQGQNHPSRVRDPGRYVRVSRCDRSQSRGLSASREKRPTRPGTAAEKSRGKSPAVRATEQARHKRSRSVRR